MDIEHIKAAKVEAERFLKSLDKVLEQNEGREFPYAYGKDTADLRRKSMDLTRSLSKMRNGDRYE